LKENDFFFDVEENQLEALVQMTEKISYPEGESVLQEGDPAESFFIISSGRVSIWHLKNLLGKKVHLGDLNKGSFFGEIALLTGQPRSATVITEEPCVFYVLHKSHFKSILENNPSIATAMEYVLQRRWFSSYTKLREQQGT